MPRVSERSNAATLDSSMHRVKNKLEELQTKGSSLKRVVRPSDDPNGNNDVIRLKGQKVYTEQLKRNIGFVMPVLQFTENALQELNDIMLKVKELAIAQASDFYNADVRKNVAMEVQQLRNQVLAIANRQIGSRYLFGGLNINDKPFPNDREYRGDEGRIFIEVLKDFKVPINIPGSHIFLSRNELIFDLGQGLSIKDNHAKGIFHQLKTFEEALYSNEPSLIREFLEDIVATINKLISLRTDIGAISNSVANAESSLDESNIINERRKSMIEDADITDVFSELEKQNEVLKATYKAGSKILANNLMTFLR